MYWFSYQPGFSFFFGKNFRCQNSNFKRGICSIYSRTCKISQVGPNFHYFTQSQYSQTWLGLELKNRNLKNIYIWKRNWYVSFLNMMELAVRVKLSLTDVQKNSFFLTPCFFGFIKTKYSASTINSYPHLKSEYIISKVKRY